MSNQKHLQVRIGLVLLAYIAFVALGMPDGLLGVGWPSMRAGFHIPLDYMGMFLFASTFGYISSSFMAGRLLRKLGVGGLLAASCGLTGLALFSYTLVPAWWMMVLLGVFGGVGAGAIDAGLNTYVAENFTEGLMQWLHASYGVGVTLGPLIMTFGLSSLGKWHFGYRVVAIFQIILALSFVLTIKMWGKKTKPDEEKTEKKITEYKTSYAETLKHVGVWLSFMLFVFYVGAEIGLGSWTYTLLTESRGMDPKIAGFWAGSFYLLFTIGRILAGLYAKKLSTNTIIFMSVTGALVGSFLLWLSPINLISLIGVVLIGFSIAPIFPALISGTADRVGDRFAANTIGMQMAAAGLGGALLPSLFGVLARRISLEIIPVCLVVCFACFLILYLFSVRQSVKRANQTVEIPAQE